MSGHDQLAEALGAGPAAGEHTAAHLDDGDAAALAALVTQARKRQRDDLRAAIDGGLSHVPRLLRGPIKKLMFR